MDNTQPNPDAQQNSEVASPQPAHRPYDWLPYLNTLFSCLREGVVFVDRDYVIRTWSNSTELITSVPESETVGYAIRPCVLNLHSVHGDPVADEHCPVAACMQTGKIRRGDFRIVGRSGRDVKVELTATPVIDENNVVQGCVILLHDTSIQLDLQKQLRDLYEISVLDPLTQVANRGEFERVLAESIRTSRLSGEYSTCLIICDIDYFKSINDNFNHHVGDQALIAFAGQLKEIVRSEDLVCRYGGEEFVVLCADCDINSAIGRAEEIRASLESRPQTMLNGKCITASFGVSDLRPHDTATDFFVRADSALLKAKELGRNRVVAASDSKGNKLKSVDATSVSGVEWRVKSRKALVSEEYVTQTPVTVLVEKLRGFIFEHDADIRQVESDFASIEIEIEDPANYARRGRFRVSFEFCERPSPEENGRLRSFIRIEICEARRKWFSTNDTSLAPKLLSEIRRYMMISDEGSQVKLESAGQPTPGR